MPRKIVIEINFPVLLAMFAVLFAAGWVEGYRRRGDFQALEAQNARIIQLLEGAEITRVVELGASEREEFFLYSCMETQNVSNYTFSKSDHILTEPQRLSSVCNRLNKAP